MVKLKRIYEESKRNDEFRILVDRLWPRGISKEKAALDLWLKNVTPSDALRKWYGHNLKQWPAFQKKYRSEIAANKETFEQLRVILHKKKVITLLFAAKNEKHNGAVVIRNLLKS